MAVAKTRSDAPAGKGKPQHGQRGWRNSSLLNLYGGGKFLFAWYVNFNNVLTMYFKSKKVSLAILAITSLVVSRPMFFFFDDPEGTNLLVTIVTASFVYMLSLSLYVINLRVIGLKRLLLTICFQISIVLVLYFCLK